MLDVGRVLGGGVKNLVSFVTRKPKDKKLDEEADYVDIQTDKNDTYKHVIKLFDIRDDFGTLWSMVPPGASETDKADVSKGVSFLLQHIGSGLCIHCDLSSFTETSKRTCVTSLSVTIGLNVGVHEGRNIEDALYAYPIADGVPSHFSDCHLAYNGLKHALSDLLCTNAKSPTSLELADFAIENLKEVNKACLLLLEEIFKKPLQASGIASEYTDVLCDSGGDLSISALCMCTN